MSREMDALRIVSFESRRRDDMARLLEKQGCEVLRAPSMREMSLEDQHDAFAFGDTLLAGACDVLVLLTGVGTRMLVDAMATQRPREEVIAALGHVELACRGPKPVAALREMGLRPTVVAPEPNTWRELLDTLDRELPVQGRTVHVQEYGRSNVRLLESLRERGAKHVEPVRLYGWTLPDDTRPLQRAVESILAGAVEGVAFTSGQQVENLLHVADQGGHADALKAALRERVLVASVGPVTTEVLQSHGLPADLEPEHPKMGHLARTLGRQGRDALARKRAG